MLCVAQLEASYDGPIPPPGTPTIVGRKRQTERESIDPPFCKTFLSYSLKHKTTHTHTQNARMGQIIHNACIMGYLFSNLIRFNYAITLQFK
jgi:hypothetical protein